MKTRSFPYLFAILAALITIYGLWRYDRVRQTDQLHARREATARQLNSLSNRLMLLLNGCVSTGQTLADYASVSPDLSEEDFQSLVANLAQRQGGHAMNWMGLIRDGRVEYFHALDHEEQMQGKLLDELPEMNQPALQALNTRQITFYGPVGNPSGDLQLVVFIPVLADNRDAPDSKATWDLAAIEFRLLPLLRQAGVISQEASIWVAIRKSTPGTGRRRVFYGDPAYFESRTASAFLSLSENTQWEVAAVPASSFGMMSGDRAGYWMIGLSLALAISLLVWFLARIPAQLSRAVQVATSALRDSEERFRSLFEATFEAVIVHDAGQVLDVNHAFEQLFGYSLAEIAGKDARVLVVPIQRNLVSRKIEMHDKHPYELRMIRKDGSQFDAEAVGKDHVYRGRVVRVVAIRDITERKRNEAALQQRVDFETLVNSISTHFINLMPVAFDSGIEKALQTLGTHLGADCTFLLRFASQTQRAMGLMYEWNATGTEAPFGGIRQFTMERTPWLLETVQQGQLVLMGHPDDLPPEAVMEREFFENRGTRSLVSMPLNSGGRVIGMLGLESRSTGVAWQQEQVAQLRVISEMFAGAIQRKQADETLHQTMSDLDSANRLLQQYSANLKTMVEERTAELEREREKALQASRAKSEFLSTMSHELRTPLNSILGLAQVVLMKVGPDLPDQQKENLKAIVTSGRRLLDLINQLLDLSRIEAGRIDVRVTHFPVDLPVLEAFESVRPLAERKGLAYRIHNEAKGLHMRSDNDKLVQILINLLGNAVKFTDSGEIELIVKEEGPGISFTVRDTGIGIDPSHEKAVFEPFQQADSSSTRRHGGSGLGLSISRRLSLLLGGELTFESQPGAGSTFKLWVPRNLTVEVPAIKLGA